MEDYKKLLTELYKAHEPERLNQIDYFLERYKGKEKQFYISQKAKYMSRKPVSDSRKIIEEALARIRSQSTEKKEIIEPLDEILNTTYENFDKTFVEDEKPIAPQQVDEEIKLAVPVFERIVEKKIEEEVIQDIKEVKKTEFIRPPFEEKTPEPSKSSTTSRKDFISSRNKAKDTAWFDEKKGASNTSSPKAFELPTDKNSNKDYFIYIFGIVLLVITISVIAFFLFIYTPRTKQYNVVPENTKKTITDKQSKAETTAAKDPIVEPKIEKKTEITPVKTPVIVPKVEKKTVTTSSKTTIEKPKIEESLVVQTSPKTVVKTSPSPKQSSNIVGAMHLTKGSIQLPAYFVACYAVKTEAHAIKKINELKAKGFEASYYWIPDFVPSGNAYFKVVIGPYNSISEALRKLTPVQERAEFDAYVLELK